MKIEDLCTSDVVRLLVRPASSSREIARLHASNTMSDLIANAAHDTLLVTSLSNNQLIRIAELMDVPAICLVDGAAPSTELVERAGAAGTTLLSSSLCLEASRDLLEARLRAAGAAGQ